MTFKKLLAFYLAFLFAGEIALAVRYGIFHVGLDYGIVTGAARDWVATGQFYLERQLHGPYQHAQGDILYPPVALVLFIPFSYLPAVAWYAVPVAIVAASLRRLRPNSTALLVMGYLALTPIGVQETASGNPFIWALAALFAAVAYGSPASLVMLKPSLLPFALYGVRRRGWWIGAAGLAALSIAFGALNVQYIHVVLDMQAADHYGSLLYSVGEYPYLAMPLVAYLGSSRRPATAVRLGATFRRLVAERVRRSSPG